jgi:hypothetical protein
MATTILDFDGQRMLTFEEVGHEPGLVFLYANAVKHDGSRGQEGASFAINKAALIGALKAEFGLEDPLEALMAL